MFTVPLIKETLQDIFLTNAASFYLIFTRSFSDVMSSFLSDMFDPWGDVSTSCWHGWRMSGGKKTEMCLCFLVFDLLTYCLNHKWNKIKPSQVFICSFWPKISVFKNIKTPLHFSFFFLEETSNSKKSKISNLTVLLILSDFNLLSVSVIPIYNNIILIKDYFRDYLILLIPPVCQTKEAEEAPSDEDDEVCCNYRVCNDHSDSFHKYLNFYLSGIFWN